MTGWGYALMIVVMVLAWALVAVAIIAALRVIASTSQRPPRSSPDLPEQLLAERFARGEIDDEEFRRRLTALRSGTGRP
ncbi:SHOCT domain-containing protein [Nocardia cyriacigeorgica]|nr:SHOCT domain-containing protein [Nocardia cyriacigeorgica]